MSDIENKLVAGARRLAEGSHQARLWVENVRRNAVSVANEAHGLSTATRRTENLARKMAKAAGRRNCVGVFGPSQAGKSYLVSVLARKPMQPPRVVFGNLSKDFLKEINPPGDRESTGLVTRFTIHGGGVQDPEYPVELRLLNETDLVKILANSFLSDFDANNMTVAAPDEARIREVIQAAEGATASVSAAPHLGEIELYDLGDYFHRNFAARIRAFSSADYWEAIIRVAGRLPLPARAKLFAPLWGELQPFTDLFVMLAGALERLGHTNDAHGKLEALIPRERSIIDVMLVKQQLGVTADAADQVGLRPVSETGLGPPVTLPRAVLCALVAELKIVMDSRPWPFFDHTDLLDFPGARSRLKLNNLPGDHAEREEQVRELFLRGKIAFLFQRYTEERELTALLLCMPPSTAEVKDLAPLTRSWIEETHGATAEARAKVRNALFLILTKFDLEFLEKGGETAESRRGKWDRRLDASFLEMYGKDGWPQNWDGAPFNNTLFLRNPGMKQEHLMDYTEITRDADGSQKLVEKGPAQRQAALLSEYRDAFNNSRLCAEHFRDHDEVWNAAFEPNDGGIGLLVRRLDSILDPDLKNRQVEQRLLKEAAALYQIFKRFYFADDDNARREREQMLAGIRVKLNTAFKPSDYTLFSILVGRLVMREADGMEIFRNVAALKMDRSAPPPRPDIDDDPWATPASTQAAPPQPSKAPADRSDVFAEMIMNRWTEGLRSLSQDAGLLSHIGVAGSVIDDLVQEIIVGANRCSLGADIADGVRAQIQAANTRWDDVADRAVSIAMMRLNDYVAYLGFGAVEESRRPGFPEAPQPRQRAAFALPPLPERLPALGGRRQAMERDRFIDWGVALRQLGLDNISFAGGREIGEQQNRALGDILATVAFDPAVQSSAGRS